MDTLLAYAQYCISCATSDNTRHVLCSHFSAEEISEAKDLLWEKLELPEQKRTNSSKRPASEANVGDIMDTLSKIDISTDNHVFYVDPMGIGRLPRFNPENLNVVAVDHRIAELVDNCRVLQGQVDSYRTLAMRCTDRLDVYDTELQQHSNLLREIKYQQSPYLLTAPNIVRNVDRNVDRNIGRNVDRNVLEILTEMLTEMLIEILTEMLTEMSIEILTEMLTEMSIEILTEFLTVMLEVVLAEMMAVMLAVMLGEMSAVMLAVKVAVKVAAMLAVMLTEMLTVTLEVILTEC